MEWKNQPPPASCLLACPRTASGVGRSAFAVLEGDVYEQIPEGPSVFLLSLSGMSAALST